jgi:hypothetical protein
VPDEELARFSAALVRVALDRKLAERLPHMGTFLRAECPRGRRGNVDRAGAGRLWEAGPVKRARRRSVLITDAERSQDDQLRGRQIRYVVMMSLRALCLVLAAVLAGLRVPLLWLWLSLCGLGMVLLPWLAVILANDRPPKERHRLSHKLRRRRREAVPPRALPQPRSDARTIDAEP